MLTHWCRVTHICVSRITNIGSDNGLSPGRRQAIIWTNVGILLIRTLGTNFSEILSEIHTFSFKKMHLKMSSAKWRPFCLGLNVLTNLNYRRKPPSNWSPGPTIPATLCWHFMMTSSHGNGFRVTGPLWRESVGQRWIPLTKASDKDHCVSIYLRLKKQPLSKQSSRRWFETSSCTLWHHCIALVMRWKHFPHYWPFVREIYRSLISIADRALMWTFDAFVG